MYPQLREFLGTRPPDGVLVLHPLLHPADDRGHGAGCDLFRPPLQVVLLAGGTVSLPAAARGVGAAAARYGPQCQMAPLELPRSACVDNRAGHFGVVDPYRRDCRGGRFSRCAVCRRFGFPGLGDLLFGMVLPARNPRGEQIRSRSQTGRECAIRNTRWACSARKIRRACRARELRGDRNEPEIRNIIRNTPEG